MKAPDRHHPSDERLIALYFGDEEAGIEAPKAVRQHVHACETCTWRYTELTAPLQQLRVDAASEADEVFTPPRLDAQRAAIQHRLANEAREARVVPFPTAAVRRDRPLVRRPVARWIAGAAAAGLLLGISIGRLLDLRDHSTGLRPAVTQNLARQTSPQPVVSDTPAALDVPPPETAFLTEVDSAVRQQHIAELYALDALTPHPREAVLALR